MERRVLIAIDGSVGALKAVDYVGRTFAPVAEFIAVLLYILPAPPPILQESKTDGQSLARLSLFKSKTKKQAESVLNRAQEELGRLGWEGRRIETKLLNAASGAAKDIVFEAQNGLYDAVALGRRGLGRLQEMFLGSVSQQVVSEAKTVPVWVVDGEPVGSKVLLALDGSEDSFRAVDHVGFILARQPQVEVFLSHVSTQLADYCPLGLDEELRELQDELESEEEDHCLRTFFAKAMKMLVEAGVPKERISVRFKRKGLEVARAILQEARETGCGTVVVGRRGVSKVKELFLGSVSARVLQGANDLAVWVVG